jgi:hypothetical protein
MDKRIKIINLLLEDLNRKCAASSQSIPATNKGPEEQAASK